MRYVIEHITDYAVNRVDELLPWIDELLPWNIADVLCGGDQLEFAA